ncbi:MAG TPA: potassium channel protein [Acidimicrobiales bacterium]|nr:potassium channel protein [Acidimicrobiales bacterium]
MARSGQTSRTATHRGVGEAAGGRLPAGRRLSAGLLAMVAVIVAGTAGYMGFGYSLLDAAFQTIITVSTVGYGEIHSFGRGEKIFTIGLILFGVGSAAYTLSVLFEFFVEGYLGGAFRRRRMDQEIRSMRDHVIVCGWGRVGTAIARSLHSHDASVVVVDSSTERLETVTGPYVHGDATDEDVLRAAGIDRARVLITALPEDADNLYVTLTGRSMRPDLFIVSRSASRPAVSKLVQAGANRVVDPQDLGGARMAALAVQPHVAEFLDVVMHDGSLDFRLEQVEIPAGSPLAGQTLRSARIHDQTGTLVLAMREPGAPFRTNPSPGAEIVAGEVLIVIGDAEQVDRLRALAGTVPAGRGGS